MTTTAILTDIEGTTTDIQFVHRVLFPYAYEKLPAFLREHAEAPALAPILEQARDELGDPDADLDTLIAAFRHWIEQDRKVTPLKTLQGLIWVQGYRQGDFTGHLYKDAWHHLKRWHEGGIRLYVFSSGSVKAQQLLFGFSDFGDLTPLFSGYFDTTTGPKRDAESYREIALRVGCPAGEILFLSDVTEELDAAREAGMRTCLLARDARPGSSSHPVAASFDDISV